MKELQELIDRAIKSLTESSIATKNQDDVMKLTQAAANLTHVKLNLQQYHKNE